VPFEERRREMPRFLHDCEDCKFITAKWGRDWYFCPVASSSGSIIARKSSVPSDYWAMPASELLAIAEKESERKDSRDLLPRALFLMAREWAICQVL
jgi:hypothetical protein